MSEQPVLIKVLRRPEAAALLAPAQWNELIGSARHARLLPRLALLLEQAPFFSSLPGKARQQLLAARPAAEQHERIIRWEVNRIQQALRTTETKLVLLKGAAYLMAGLPAGRGRLVTDVDILVPRRDIRAAEQALMAAGWRAVKLHPYDQRFYREWSHELPPLRHEQRGSVVDVHHNILPRTGRLRPDAHALLEGAVRIGDSPGLKTRPTSDPPDLKTRPTSTGELWTLGPEDMVLHCAAHLFQDGDLAGSIRDLVDADALLQHFGQQAGFWERLVRHARHHELDRPLFYTLRFARRLLGTPVPESMERALLQPPVATLYVMDRLVARALLPITGARATLGEETARTFLYARSHWLRMPPRRLAVHLARKAARRWQKDDV